MAKKKKPINLINKPITQSGMGLLLTNTLRIPTKNPSGRGQEKNCHQNAGKKKRKKRRPEQKRVSPSKRRELHKRRGRTNKVNISRR